MAIDTAAKRASALNFGSENYILPPPDGTIGQADRQSLVNFYGGILVVAPTVVPAVSCTVTFEQTVSKTVTIEQSVSKTVTFEQTISKTVTFNEENC